MTNTATFILARTSHTGARQELFRLNPFLDGHEYVVASAVDVPYSGPETYIFPANRDGKIVDWGELNGSMRGTLDIDYAMENAGYVVIRDSE